MNKAKVMFIVSILFLALALAGVSAFELTASDMAGSHNSAISGSFVVKNADLSTNMTNVSCSVAVGNWTTSVSCPSVVEKNSSKSISFSVNAPQYAISGVYPGTISVSGILNGAVSNLTSFNVNVAKTFDFSLNLQKVVDEIYQDEKSNITVRITNTGNLPLNANFSYSGDLSNGSITLSRLNASLEPSNYTDVVINIDASDENMGANAVIFRALAYDANNSVEKSVEDSFDIFYPLCEAHDSGYIELYEIMNDDELEDSDFRPLDTVDVEVKVRNNDDERRYAIIRSVLVYKNEKVDNTETKEKIRVEESDTLEATLSFKLPSDVKEGTNYIYISASDDENEDNCQQKIVKINVDKEPYEVIPYNVEVKPSKVNCTGEFSLSGRVINLGSNDEDKVRVVYNDDFGNTESKVIGNLDEGKESSLFSFSFAVPKDASEKAHLLSLDVYYDYNDANDEYGETRSFEYSLGVEGGCSKPAGEFSFTPQLTGFAGKDIYVSVVIENTGEDSDFRVEASCDWAEITEISPSNMTLKNGESRNVVIKLGANSGVGEGVHNIDVKIISGEKTETITIPVYVYKSAGILDVISDNLKFETKQTWLWMAIVAVLIFVFFIFILYFMSRPGMPNIVKTFPRAQA